LDELYEGRDQLMAANAKLDLFYQYPLPQKYEKADFKLIDQKGGWRFDKGKLHKVNAALVEGFKRSDRAFNGLNDVCEIVNGKLSSLLKEDVHWLC